MNATSRPFYTEQALYESFMNSLSLAELAGDISAAEHVALASAAQEKPTTSTVQAHRLFLSRQQCRPVNWAGALLFRASSSPGAPVFLFSVSGALRRFTSESVLRQALEQQLDDPGQRSELMRFTPLDVRAALVSSAALTLDSRQLASPVMQHASQAIDRKSVV